MAAWSFIAIGRPAPQGSKSFKGMAAGHAILVESSKAVKPWREAVKTAAPPGPTLDGPLAVHMVFTMQRPSSARKADRSPSKAPDLSKLIRATEDAITDAGLWADDARVSRMYAAKVWSDYDPWALKTPGVLVAAIEIGDAPWEFELKQHATLTLLEHKQSWR
jgi:Holliday junction resolvase RusA-like endonuclease